MKRPPLAQSAASATLSDVVAHASSNPQVHASLLETIGMFYKLSFANQVRILRHSAAIGASCVLLAHRGRWSAFPGTGETIRVKQGARPLHLGTEGDKFLSMITSQKWIAVYDVSQTDAAEKRSSIEFGFRSDDNRPFLDEEIAVVMTADTSSDTPQKKIENFVRKEVKEMGLYGTIEDGAVYAILFALSAEDTHCPPPQGLGSNAWRYYEKVSEAVLLIGRKLVLEDISNSHIRYIFSKPMPDFKLDRSTLSDKKGDGPGAVTIRR